MKFLHKLVGNPVCYDCFRKHCNCQAQWQWFRERSQGVCGVCEKVGPCTKCRCDLRRCKNCGHSKEHHYEHEGILGGILKNCKACLTGEWGFKDFKDCKKGFETEDEMMSLEESREHGKD